MMKVKVMFFVAALAVCCALGAAAAEIPGAADPCGGLPPDIKPLALEAYGIRGAVATSPTNIVVVIGASTTKAREAFWAWRVMSEEDPAYAYELFVAPKSTKKVVSALEFPFPEDFSAPWPAHSPLQRHVIELTLKTPLKQGVEYGLVGIGADGNMVTAAKTGCLFKWDGGTSATEPKSIRVPADDMAPRMYGLRRVSPVGDGKIVVEFGATFSASGGSEMSNYRVTVNGKAAPVKGLGRRTKIDVYLPEGWPFKTILQHDVFLDIGRELKNGDRVEVSVADKVCSGLREGGFKFDQDATLTRSIQANQIGYLPDSPKVAYLGCWMGSFPEGVKLVTEYTADNAPSLAEIYAQPPPPEPPAAEAENQKQETRNKEQETLVLSYSDLAPYALRFHEPPAFDLVREKDGKAVFSDRAVLTHNGFEKDGRANHSGSNVYTLDFSQFAEPGRYYLRVKGVGRSISFDIGKGVYERAFKAQSSGVFAQRCGFELTPDHAPGWRRIACHTKGVQTSTVKRWTVGEFGPFRENPVMVPNKHFDEMTAKLRLLDEDPALAAHFPLEGDTRNVAPGSSVTLNQLGEGNRWVNDKEFDTKVLVSGERDNGFEGEFALDPDVGATVVFWFRRDDAAGNKWGGTVFSFGGPKEENLANLTANWGLLHMRDAIWNRVGDNKWRQYAIRVTPNNDGTVHAELLSNGHSAGNRDVKKFATTGFVLGRITDDAAPGCHLRDLRIYSRPLTDEEIRRLGTKITRLVPEVIPLVGGHHDAGDYNPRSHLDVAQTLMAAYEHAPSKFRDGQLDIPEAGNGLPDIVDEALWAIRPWVALQDEDGGVRDGTESDGDPNFVQTVELDPKGDFAYAKNSRASFNAAGAFAQASRILKACGRKKEAADLLSRARHAYDWGVAHFPDGTTRMSTVGEYRHTSRAYAAAEMLHTTGDKRFLNDFRANCPWVEIPGAEMAIWQQYDASLAAYAFLRIPERENPDPALRKTILNVVLREADRYIEKGSDVMAYKFIRHDNAPLSWGAGAYSGHIRPVLAAWFATGDRKYRDWIIRSCDNTLGANPLGLSWVVGLGERTVRAPLHNSRYRPAGVVADGMQVEGPLQSGSGYNYDSTAYPPHRSDFAILHAFVDCHFAIGMDEGVISNQALTMAVFSTLLP